MTGYLLFKHAVKRVFQNLDDALAISGLIWIGVMAVMVLASMYTPTMPITPEEWLAITSRDFMGLLIPNLIVLAAGIWVAVEWHRFVLLGEKPQTILPPLRASVSASYLGKSIQIMAVLFGFMFIVSIVISVLVSIVAAVVPVLAALFSILYLGAFIMALQIFYRVSPMLPAAALGKSITLKSAWTATEDHKTPIFHAAIILALGTMVLNVPSLVLGQGVIGLVYSLVTGWIALMVGVSLLSAIYELSVSEDSK